MDVPILFKEVKSIVDQGVPMPKILVSDRAQMVMSYRKIFGAYEGRRASRREKSFGSTKSNCSVLILITICKIGFQVSELLTMNC